MEDNKAKQIIQRVIDNSLSGIEDDPWLAQRVLSNAKGEKTVKRKMFLSIVLATVILLMMGVALASALFPNLIQMLKLQENPAVMNMVESVNYEWETEYVTAKVREMMYDGHGVYALVDIGAKNESVILLPNAGSVKCGLKNDASVLGVKDNKPNETIAEYAARKGKTVVYFNTAMQSEERTFQAYGFPLEGNRNDDGTWTQALCFPAETESSQVRVRVYTTVYDDPLVQSKLDLRDPQRPLSEPHSITIPISAMKTIEPVAGDEHPEITEHFKLGYIGIQRASTYQTDVAQYVEINFDNFKKEEYSIVYVTIESDSPSIKDHSRVIQYLWPKDVMAGYAAGFRYVMTSIGGAELPEEFDVVVVGEYENGRRADLGRAHIVFHKSDMKAE